MARPRKDGAPPAPTERRSLTDLFVKTAVPVKRRRRVYDTSPDAFGLALFIEPSGHRSYKLPYRYNGRPRLFHIGDATKLGLKDAREIAREKWGQIARGVDIQSERVAARKAATFEELLDRYRDEHLRPRNRSWQQTDSAIRRHALKGWRHLPAADVTRADVQRLHAEIGRTAPVAANHFLGCLSGMYSWAIRNGAVALAANPCSGIERFPEKRRERVLKDGEIGKLWAALHDMDPARAGALKLILLTGQRPGEVARMRREHVDVGNRRWTLPGEADEALGWPGTKNGQTHEVHLTDSALAIIGNGSDGFVFPGVRGGPVSRLERAMASLDFDPPARPHDLRRTFSALVTGLGLGRDALNRVTNQKAGGIAGVHDRHRYRDGNRAVWEAVAARIEHIVQGAGDRNVVPVGK